MPVIKRTDSGNFPSYKKQYCDNNRKLYIVKKERKKKNHIYTKIIAAEIDPTYKRQHSRIRHFVQVRENILFTIL